MPAIPPSEVKMIECHSNLSFIKMMAKEDTPIPLNDKVFIEYSQYLITSNHRNFVTGHNLI